ncbi:MAG TPA: porin [Burkholderiaceae bacterium]
MKKSLMAVALLGAFAGVAHAQTSVTIYGNVDANISKTTGRTAAIGKGDNNRLGFRGTEDLGGGLKAVFQLEIRYEPDTGTLESVTRPLFQGESRVGLQGDFGMVRIGRGLTAMQAGNIPFEPWSYVPSRAGFATDIAVAGYTSDPLSGAGNSGNRFSNAVFYNSPVLGGGFSFAGVMATKEANGSVALVGRGTTAAPQFGPNAEAATSPLSFSGQYTNGPFGAMLTYERNAIDTKYLGAGAYFQAMPALKLMAMWSRQDQSANRLVNDTTSAWLLGANYVMGAGKLLAGYGEKKPEGLVATRQFSLGYEHSLSKRTYLYVDAMNKKTGALNTSTTINYFDVGVHHKF